MILAVDIGNTNIVIGCINGKDCAFVERLSTVRTKTELEYAIDIKNVLDIYHIKRTDLEGGIISSVVPQITTAVKLAVEKILKKEPLVVGAGAEYPDRQSGAARQRPGGGFGGGSGGISRTAAHF